MMLRLVILSVIILTVIILAVMGVPDVTVQSHLELKLYLMIEEKKSFFFFLAIKIIKTNGIEQNF